MSKFQIEMIINYSITINNGCSRNDVSQNEAKSKKSKETKELENIETKAAFSEGLGKRCATTWFGKKSLD